VAHGGSGAKAPPLAARPISVDANEIWCVQNTSGGGDGDAAMKRRLEKAMRRFVRTEGLLKKQSFENWVNDYTTIKDFKAKVGMRSNLKRLYFDQWTDWCSERQNSVALCEKMHAKKNTLQLREAWHAWGELHEEEAEKEAEMAVDTTDPAHLASLLRKLEAAVVETHQKHSCLLEMTHNEEVMGTLLQRLSPAACDTLRHAGITKIEHLVHLTMGQDKVGPYDDTKLKSYGIDDPHDLKRIEMFLVNPESFELGGAPPAGDFDQKREQLLDDMSSLREKLDLKKEKLMREFPDESAQSQANQQAGKPKDPNLGVLHELLGALGVAQQEEPAEADVPDAPEVEDTDYVGQKAQAQRDKDTNNYIAKLKSEGTANQSVLQALALSLGEVGEPADDNEVVDTDTDIAKKAFSDKIESMEATMDVFVKAMTRARELLDNDDPDEEETALAKGALVEPYDRAEELSLGTHTNAELESQKLAEDVERRHKQTDALESENMQLKEQLRSLRMMQARPPVSSSRPAKSSSVSDGRKSSSKQHWSASISDPELAQKYGQLPDEGESSFVGDGDDEDNDEYALEDRYLDTGFVDSLLAKENTPTNFAWSLNSVDSSTPFSVSSVFDSLLEDTIQRGREAVRAHIDLTQVELDDLQKDVVDARDIVDRFHARQEELQKKGPKSSRPNTKQLQEQALVNDREWRDAEDCLKSLTTREDALQDSLTQLKLQFDALDVRTELDNMDRKMNDEVAAATEELRGLIDAEELDPTPEVTERIAEVRDKVQRIEASWKLKRNLRIKEIEIEIMGQKMADDEAMLKNDVAKSKGVYAHNANNARGELSKVLQNMEDSVTVTARGRCRPEVLASMPAVQKLRGAVNRHKLALQTTQLAERKKLLEEQKADNERKEADELEKVEEAEMKKMRATADLSHREKRLADISEALNKRKREMFSEASELLADAKSAADGKSLFSQMYITKVDGTKRHAKSFLTDAKAIYDDIEGSIDPVTEQTGKADLDARKTELETLEQAVAANEKQIVDDAKQALVQIDGLLKKDLRKMSEPEVEVMATVRKTMESLLPSLNEINTLEDATRVKSRDLSGTEEKLRHSWARLAPKLDDALYKELTVGDKSLDVVQAALANGKLSTATKELLKAGQAYNKVKSANK